MLQSFATNPFGLLSWFGSLLIAITVHEFAHAWMSDRLGDPTAKIAGRLTLNPFAHLDPIGTLMILFFRFGWGKPVPFEPMNLRNPKRDAALIALAGPASGFILAALVSGIIRLTHFFSVGPAYLLEIIFTPLIVLSIGLSVFNLLPIHPLDGGKVIYGLLPFEWAERWDEITSQYGLAILIFVLLPLFGGQPLITRIIWPIINFCLALFLPGTPLI